MAWTTVSAAHPRALWTKGRHGQGYLDNHGNINSWPTEMVPSRLEPGRDTPEDVYATFTLSPGGHADVNMHGPMRTAEFYRLLQQAHPDSAPHWTQGNENIDQRWSHESHDANKPPHYFVQKTKKPPERCGVCTMFDKGKCWGYGNTKVAENGVCESFTKDKRTSGSTLPQEKRLWEAWNRQERPWTGNVVHSFPSGHTIQSISERSDMNRVGTFLQNCWRGNSANQQWIDTKAGYGHIPHTLHDEHGLPRVAFWTALSPNTNETWVTNALGHHNRNVTADQYGMLGDFAEANGYRIEDPPYVGQPAYLGKIAMPVTPDYWQDYLQRSEHGRVLFHATHPRNVQSILSQGLRPASEIGQSPYQGVGNQLSPDWFMPRPGHTYFAQDPYRAKELAEEHIGPLKVHPAVMKIDPSFMDPQHINPDEDDMANNDFVGVNPQDYEGYDSLGQIAEDKGWGNDTAETQGMLDLGRTLAYRGTVPPSHIRPGYMVGNQWHAAVPHPTNGWASPMVNYNGTAMHPNQAYDLMAQAPNEQYNNWHNENPTYAPLHAPLQQVAASLASDSSEPQNDNSKLPGFSLSPSYTGGHEEVDFNGQIKNLGGDKQDDGPHVAELDAWAKSLKQERPTDTNVIPAGDPSGPGEDPIDGPGALASVRSMRAIEDDQHDAEHDDDADDEHEGPGGSRQATPKRPQPNSGQQQPLDDEADHLEDREQHSADSVARAADRMADPAHERIGLWHAQATDHPGVVVGGDPAPGQSASSRAIHSATTTPVGDVIEHSAYAEPQPREQHRWAEEQDHAMTLSERLEERYEHDPFIDDLGGSQQDDPPHLGAMQPEGRIDGQPSSEWCTHCHWNDEEIPSAPEQWQHPDPWMDNEPGTLTFPQHWTAQWHEAKPGHESLEHYLYSLPRHTHTISADPGHAQSQPMRYFHSTDAALKPGDIIQPAAQGYGDEWSKGMPGYDPGKVYIFDQRHFQHPHADPHYPNTFANTYEVEPLGPIEQDPEGPLRMQEYEQRHGHPWDDERWSELHRTGQSGCPECMHDYTHGDRPTPEWYDDYNWRTTHARVKGLAPEWHDKSEGPLAHNSHSHTEPSLSPSHNPPNPPNPPLLYRPPSRAQHSPQGLAHLKASWVNSAYEGDMDCDECGQRHGVNEPCKDQQGGQTDMPELPADIGQALPQPDESEEGDGSVTSAWTEGQPEDRGVKGTLAESADRRSPQRGVFLGLSGQGSSSWPECANGSENRANRGGDYQISSGPLLGVTAVGDSWKEEINSDKLSVVASEKKSIGPMALGAVCLVLHGGAFIGNSTQQAVKETLHQLKRQGIEAIDVKYPLDDRPSDAYRYAKQYSEYFRAKGKHVYAMGFSAGGTIASWLASHGDVDAAVSVAPVTDFTTWQFKVKGDLKAESPLYNFGKKPSPQMILHAQDDAIVPFAQSQAYAQAVPHVNLISIPSGNHYITNQPQPKGWHYLEQQATNSQGKPVIYHGPAPKRLPPPWKPKDPRDPNQNQNQTTSRWIREAISEPGVYYHVAPASARPSILQRGLQGQEEGTTLNQSPWKRLNDPRRADLPMGNYFFEHPEEAYDYMVNLKQRTVGEGPHGDGWYDYGVHPGGGYGNQSFISNDPPPPPYDDLDGRDYGAEYDDEDYEPQTEPYVGPHQLAEKGVPASHHGYDLWKFRQDPYEPHHMEYDPESAIYDAPHGQDWRDQQPSMWEALQGMWQPADQAPYAPFFQHKPQEMTNPGTENYTDTEPVRWVTRQGVPPQQLELAEHVPHWDVPSYPDEQGWPGEDAGQYQIPDQFTRVPRQRYFGGISSDPFVCNKCMSPSMSEPKQLAPNKWIQQCANCGVSREIAPNHPIVKMVREMVPAYPKELMQVGPVRPMAASWHEAAESDEEDELHVGLDIPPKIRNEIKTWVDEQEWPKGTELEDPSDYHITLLYVAEGYEEHKDADWLYDADGYEVEVTALDDSFGQDPEKKATVLKIKCDELLAHANDLIDAAENRDLPIKRFPGGYRAHLTLAYGPGKPAYARCPKLKFRTEPSSVSLPRGLRKKSERNSPQIPHFNDPQWSTVVNSADGLASDPHSNNPQGRSGSRRAGRAVNGWHEPRGGADDRLSRAELRPGSRELSGGHEPLQRGRSEWAALDGLDGSDLGPADADQPARDRLVAARRSASGVPSLRRGQLRRRLGEAIPWEDEDWISGDRDWDDWENQEQSYIDAFHKHLTETPELRPWARGQDGKGLIDRDGKLHLWATDGMGIPHHDVVSQYHGIPYQAKVDVVPNGKAYVKPEESEMPVDDAYNIIREQGKRHGIWPGNGSYFANLLGYYHARRARAMDRGVLEVVSASPRSDREGTELPANGLPARAASAETGERHQGLGEDQRLSMALRPGDLQGLIERQGHPYAFHLTDPQNISSIQANGLLPWDHPSNPMGTDYGGELQPRPGHTYMSLRYPSQQNAHGVAIDLRKLDPNLMNPDEDSLGMYNKVPADLPEGLHPAWQQIHAPYKDRLDPSESWGQIAENHNYGDDPDHTLWGTSKLPNIAYRGHVPPEAILPMDEWERQYRRAT